MRAWVMGVEERPDGRPLVHLSAGGELPAIGGAGPRRRRPARAWGALASVLVVGLVLHHQLDRPRWSVGPAVLRDDGAVSVTLADHGVPLRVRSVVVEGEGVDAPVAGALTDEVVTAQARGLSPVHDAQRVLSTGSHTFLVGLRPSCPAAAPPAAVRVTVVVEAAGQERSTVRALDTADRHRLVCVPLTVSAGLSPLPQAAGQVTLQVTAYAGTATVPAGFRQLSWGGYDLGAVASVVPLALGWASAGGSVVFDAVVTPDCGAPAGGALAAVFEDRQLPVPLTAVARARVEALRSVCPGH